MGQRLRQLPGIGEWTAQVVAMRALGDPDAFPAGDLGVRKALGGVSAREAEARAERWRPWRAYAVMHLWTTLAKELPHDPPRARRGEPDRPTAAPGRGRRGS
jgi:AraC family transcriptional regulator of adaptative response / DNA-3-methyladenine glycosylase II